MTTQLKALEKQVANLQKTIATLSEKRVTTPTPSVKKDVSKSVMIAFDRKNAKILEGGREPYTEIRKVSAKLYALKKGKKWSVQSYNEEKGTLSAPFKGKHWKYTGRKLTTKK